MNKETASGSLCSKFHLLILQQYFIYLTHVPYQDPMHLSYWILLVHLLAWYILLVSCVPWRQSYARGNGGWSTTTTTCPFQVYTPLHIYLDHVRSPFFCHGFVVQTTKRFAIFFYFFVCMFVWYVCMEWGYFYVFGFVVAITPVWL